MRSPVLRTVLAVAAFVAASFLRPAVASALFEGTFVPNACVAGKLKCVSKMKSCLLNCHRKALKAGIPVAAECVDKCRNKFDPDAAHTGHACFAPIEAKGGCGPSVGDAATFAAKVDAHVIETMEQLTPSVSGANACAAGKTACFRKYDACVLNLVGKAAKAGTAIADLTKCRKILDLDAKSCVGKLEVKYTTCPTVGDGVQLRNRDDAFVDDAIDALVTGPRDMNTQRCSGDTSVPCTSAPGGVSDCGGPLGTCEFFFSAPIPESAGGIGICLVRQWNGSISGTFDQATGASAGTASALSNIYNGIAVDTPCPRCVGDPFPNDGASDGTCSGGARNGLPCDGNGRSPEPAFGVTSLDCPPAGLIDTLTLDLSNSTGTAGLTVTAASPLCNGAPGKLCLCATCSGDPTIACSSDAQCVLAGAGTCTNPAGEPRKPNSCLDNTETPGDGSLCVDAGNGDGFCPESPVVQHCLLQTFRECGSDGDCPADGDACGAFLGRECFPGYNGDIGDSVSATGLPGALHNGATAMGLASVYCLARSGAPAVNAATGLPGPARIRLLGVGADDGGPGCPTQASFLPTSKGPAQDSGWTGISHDFLAAGQGKITVATSCTGTYPNCNCSYTGPVQNPNVAP